MNRFIRIKMLMMLVLMGFPLLTGCSEPVSEDAAEPPRAMWMYSEHPPRNGDEARRTALVLSTEGWDGAESRAPKLGFFSDFYANNGLVVSIGLDGDNLSADCPTRGCYLYVRVPGGTWHVLHATPWSSSNGWLNVSRPWDLQMMVETSPTIEIDVPVQGNGRCLYTLETQGYDRALHVPAGTAQLDAYGNPVPEADPKIQSELEGPPPKGTLWPDCTGQFAT